MNHMVIHIHENGYKIYFGWFDHVIVVCLSNTFDRVMIGIPVAKMLVYFV